MVRNYKRKTTRGSGYSQNDVDNAVQQIKRGVLSTRKASCLFHIPYSTLNCIATGRRRTKSQTGGRAPALPFDVENRLAEHLITLEKWGFGLSRKEVFICIENFVTLNNIKTPFKFNRPGEDWFLAFKRRHGLSIKKPQSVEYARKKMTDPFIINEYFDLLFKTLTELDLFNHPDRIWNLDETSTCTDPSKTKVVGKRGKPSSRVTAGSGKENITWLAAANAVGTKAPPLIIFKGLNVWENWLPDANHCYPDTAYAASPKGWMTAEIFYNYFEKSLIPTLGTARPVLIVYDGHATHVTEKVSTLARQHNITILKLPAHTSHLLQPLDLAVFKSFKSKWDANLVAWQRKHPGQKIPKKQFSILLGSTWKELPSTVIESGFRKAGIVPYNKNVIEESVYDPEALRRWKDKKNRLVENREENTETEEDQLENTENQENVRPSSELEPGCSNTSLNCSFQDLLLRTLKESRSQLVTKPRKKIAPGAEVITQRSNVITEEAKKKSTGKKNTRLKKGCKRLCSESEEDSDLNLSEPIYQESEDDMDVESFSSLENELNTESHAQSEIEENIELSNSSHIAMVIERGNKDINIMEGMFVVAEYKDARYTRRFLGKVNEIIKLHSEVKYRCSFLRHKMGKEQFFVFPDVEDIDIIGEENIVKILNQPKKVRGRHYFPSENIAKYFS